MSQTVLLIFLWVVCTVPLSWFVGYRLGRFVLNKGKKKSNNRTVLHSAILKGSTVKEKESNKTITVTRQQLVDQLKEREMIERSLVFLANFYGNKTIDEKRMLAEELDALYIGNQKLRSAIDQLDVK